MRIDITSVLKIDGAEKEFSFETDLSEFEKDAVSKLQLARNVAVCGRAVNLCGVISVELTVSVCYQGQCARCNDLVKQAVDFPVKSDIINGCFSGDFDDVTALKQNVLLLDEYVYNIVAMSVPIRFLCKEDCKGLCGRCGKNLNQGQCSCKGKDIDPRLAVLQKLINN